VPGAVIAVVGIGGWYGRGIARLIQKFAENSPGYDILSWINTLPPGAPAGVIEDGRDYTGYCAKPFALKAAMDSGADVGILMDAAFYPIRPINPLAEHISRYGYYFCRNGFDVGSWCSDRALLRMGLTREEAFEIEEISSYCVGLDFHRPESRELLKQWCEMAADRLTFPGPHTNIGRADQNPGFPQRNPGNASPDPRVNGHRHDQTALSVIAHRLGMKKLIDRPQFTTYLGQETEKTVLVNKGGL
jgi:hypothetical protein